MKPYPTQDLTDVGRGLSNTPPLMQAQQISWRGLPRGLHENDGIGTRSDTPFKKPYTNPKA